MNRKDLSDVVHQELKEKGYTKCYRESSDVLSIIIDTVSNNIAKGKSVELSGFGNFYSKLVVRRNPKDNTKIERWGVFFKCSKVIKEKLNGR